MPAGSHVKTWSCLRFLCPVIYWCIRSSCGDRRQRICQPNADSLHLEHGLPVSVWWTETLDCQEAHDHAEPSGWEPKQTQAWSPCSWPLLPCTHSEITDLCFQGGRENERAASPTPHILHKYSLPSSHQMPKHFYPKPGGTWGWRRWVVLSTIPDIPSLTSPFHERFWRPQTACFASAFPLSLPLFMLPPLLECLPYLFTD